ncbi:hypothetical protein UlMin_006390 [Ulmus minor]
MKTRETMEKETKVEIISRKTIKPSSPTSHHNRIFKLSLLDQLLSPTYGCFMFFYYSIANNGDSSSFLERSNSLQKSLSKNLVHFYPFAGRLKDSSTIECNDEGAYFIEAQMNCKLSEMLNQPESKTLNQFLNPKTTKLAKNCVLLVQLTAFDCGGTALAVSICHKMGDASSLCTFLQSWTSLTCDHDRVGTAPKFISSSLLPPQEPKDLPKFPGMNTNGSSNGSKLANRRAKTAETQGVVFSTNVELVTAIVIKCAIAASQLASGCFKPSLLSQTVNLRKRMVPPLPENAIGNLIYAFPWLLEQSKMERHEIVATMRKGFEKFCEEKANRFKGDEGCFLLHEAVRTTVEHAMMGNNIYNCTSLCNFPLYEMDFGWGKPIGVASPMSFRNVFALMDTKWGDGIEVWVTLKEQEMAIFERDEELLARASINPSVLDLGTCSRL